MRFLRPAGAVADGEDRRIIGACRQIDDDAGRSACHAIDRGHIRPARQAAG